MTTMTKENATKMTAFWLMKINSDPRVEYADDERSIDNGIIITLRQGWTFDPMQDNRVAGADSVKKIRALLKTATPFNGPFTD